MCTRGGTGALAVRIRFRFFGGFRERSTKYCMKVMKAWSAAHRSSEGLSTCTKPLNLN